MASDVSAAADIERPKSPSRVGAPVAGVGGGTAFVAFTNSLPDNNRFKFWLLLAAPALSVLGSRLWAWGEARFWEAVWDHQFEKEFRRTTDTFERQLQRPDLEEDERKKLRQRLADLREVEASRQINRLRTTMAFQNVKREWGNEQA